MSPTGTENKGGWRTHKPGCQCRPCKSRQRLAQTGPGATGKPAAQVSDSRGEAENADLPAWTIQGRSAQDRVAEFVKLKAENPDITTEEAAHKMGIARRTLQHHLTKAGREGWLRFEDSMSRVEHEVIPLAIRNTIILLEQGDPKTTIETMKGTVFPEWRAAKGVQDQNQNILAIKIEQGHGSEPEIDVRSLGRGKDSAGTHVSVVLPPPDED